MLVLVHPEAQPAAMPSRSLERPGDHVAERLWLFSREARKLRLQVLRLARVFWRVCGLFKPRFGQCLPSCGIVTARPQHTMSLEIVDGSCESYLAVTTAFHYSAQLWS